MSAAAKQSQLLERFALFSDSQEKLAAIVEWAKTVPRFSAELRTDLYRVPGCVSPVWVFAEKTIAQKFNVRGEADSPVVRGLVCLLCEIYDEASAREILETPPTLLDELGLAQGLSITRRNGLAAVRQRLCEIARKSLQKETTDS